ncbi:hypothetical protein ACHQM5_005672 [Ranunculus cassubicifolius]
MDSSTVGWLNDYEIEVDDSILVQDMDSTILRSIGNSHSVTDLRKCDGSSTDSAKHEHVIVERKRREKLTKQFIVLSALVPGLKKTDKATVLGDAVELIKQLQERLKTLEEQTSHTTMESVVFANELQTSEGSFSEVSGEPFLEIEARVTDRNVVIQIHCENRKGIQMEIHREVEKLNLTINSSTAMKFGTSTLFIIVQSKMDKEFSITGQALVKILQSSLLQSMTNSLAQD